MHHEPQVVSCTETMKIQLQDEYEKKGGWLRKKTPNKISWGKVCVEFMEYKVQVRNK